MKKEFYSFYAALIFFTRIPLPHVKVSKEHFKNSSRYFPLVGIIVGGIAALVFAGVSRVLSIDIAVSLTIVTAILITGALHEDGLADVCDGFGGGWDKERILAIMKDSHIGVFGVIGLLLVLLLRFFMLREMPLAEIPFLLIAGHVLSRFAAMTFMYSHSYVQVQEKSRSGYVTDKINFGSLIIAAFFGLTPILFTGNLFYLLAIIPVFLVKWLLGRYFTKWIGGYTGDCLGATQQLTELTFYLFILLGPWKYF